MACNKDAIKNWVNQIIDQNIVAVFSKTYCPYCNKAISILKNFNLKCLHIEQIDNNPNVSEIQAYLKELTGKSSVPKIFINKEIIGGCDDLIKQNDEGKLQEKLKKAGAFV